MRALSSAIQRDGGGGGMARPADVVVAGGLGLWDSEAVDEAKGLVCGRIGIEWRWDVAKAGRRRWRGGMLAVVSGGPVVPGWGVGDTKGGGVGNRDCGNEATWGGEWWLRDFGSCFGHPVPQFAVLCCFSPSHLQRGQFVNCAIAMQGAIHRASALAGSPPSSWLGDAGKVGPVPVCRTWRELHFNLDACSRVVATRLAR